MRRLKLAATLATAMAVLAVGTAAQALTFVKDTYTLSGDSMSGTFTSVTAGGTEGYIYRSDGKDFIFQNITITENFPGGPSYTYTLSQNCLSITPGCGLNDIHVYSDVPGGGSFLIQFGINFYELSGSSSVVDTSFLDFVYLATGKGTLTETITRGSTAPEPAAWALMLTGVFGVGAAMRSRRRRAIASA